MSALNRLRSLERKLTKPGLIYCGIGFVLFLISNFIESPVNAAFPALGFFAGFLLLVFAIVSWSLRGELTPHEAPFRWNVFGIQ